MPVPRYKWPVDIDVAVFFSPFSGVGLSLAVCIAVRGDTTGSNRVFVRVCDREW